MFIEIVKKSGSIQNRFLLKGRAPELEIDCGMHGDEKGVIPLVEAAIFAHLSELPDTLYIPEMSPSAVMQGTRLNAQGDDINRSFLDDSRDSEAQLVMDVLRNYKFKKTVSFHEDRDDFCYVYDAGGESLEGTSALENMRSQMQSLGVELLDGIDDPADATLGNLFSRGYKHFPVETQKGDSGLSGSWLLSHGVTEKALTVEIPMHLDADVKEKLVDIFFKSLIIDPASKE